MTIPVPGGQPFVTDAGLETDLLFLRGFDLPEFAAFPLLEDDEGLAAFDSYYRDFAAIAESANVSLVLASPTWRANPDWGSKLGFDTKALDRMNRLGIKLMLDLKASLAGPETIAISGIIGPRGDGYVAGEVPDLQEAEAYHRPQIESFAAAGADIAEAITMTSANEAGGVVLAANAVGLPVAILFTVETDGRLPDGTSLRTAVERIDAIGDVAYFGINCAYPEHMYGALEAGDWLNRITEVKPNASSKSHAELDAATEIDRGDIDHLVGGVNKLRDLLPNLSVVGGCCGSDREHVARLWGVS